MTETRALIFPIQPLHTDEHGTVRFIENRIVSFLLERLPGGMNTLAEMHFTHAEREQFAQLIGYSLSGFGDLDYVRNETWETAARLSVEGQYAVETEEQARNAYLRSKLRNIQDAIATLTTSAFRIDPDDLEPQ